MPSLKLPNMQISKSMKMETLAGSYTSSEMVVLHNLRLPELDKN